MKKRQNRSRSGGSYSAVDIKQDRKRILGSTTSFTTVEEYKTLRTNLIFSTTEEGSKIIGITSTESKEGKSITCLNTAITFAEAGKKVIVLDCDLRLPTISRLLGIRGTPGVSNLLVNINTLDETVQHVQLSRAAIDVIPSGDIPPNPSELLGSDKMSSLLNALTGMYDYIFIDTPPVGAVSDAVVLSKMLTGYIIVVRSGRTEQAALSNVLSQLEYAGANLLGFVLNGISEKELRRYGKYSYKYGKYRLYGRYRYYGQSLTSRDKPPADEEK